MSGLASVPARTLITEMYAEIGAYAAGETLAEADAAFALGKLNRLFDNWNAKRAAVWASSFLTNALVPSLSPHTIGPLGATWTVDQRPVDVVGANLVLTGASPNVNTPITVRDAAWFLSLTTPTLATDIPTDVYYQPDWPNGKLFFYPVPTAAYLVQLLVRVLVGSVTNLNDAFWMPPGYRDAATLTLAEQCAPAFGRAVAQDLKDSARAARAQIMVNNDVTPTLATQDCGMPSSGGNRSNWNYLSGLMTR